MLLIGPSFSWGSQGPSPRGPYSFTAHRALGLPSGQRSRRRSHGGRSREFSGDEVGTCPGSGVSGDGPPTSHHCSPSWVLSGAIHTAATSKWMGRREPESRPSLDPSP